MPVAPFDRIFIVRGGKRSEVSIDEFRALPLDVRVTAILTKTVEFFSGAAPVDQKDALKFMRAQTGEAAGARPRT